MLGVVWSVEMHNVFDISLVVLREALNITLSMEATSENAKIVQFYSAHCLSRMQMRVVSFRMTGV